jgi:putative FmdB family regulatory protein
MPLYDYACTKCGRVCEVRHGFGESYGRPCETCGAPLRRVFNPAPVLFKGSGFYVTDSRRSASSGKPEKAKEESKPAETAAKPDAAPSSEKSSPKAPESAA